jgi:hypothetical protein
VAVFSRSTLWPLGSVFAEGVPFLIGWFGVAEGVRFPVKLRAVSWSQFA